MSQHSKAMFDAFKTGDDSKDMVRFACAQVCVIDEKKTQCNKLELDQRRVSIKSAKLSLCRRHRNERERERERESKLILRFCFISRSFPSPSINIRNQKGRTSFKTERPAGLRNLAGISFSAFIALLFLVLLAYL